MKSVPSCLVVAAVLVFASAAKAQTATATDTSATTADSAVVQPHVAVQSSIDQPAAVRRPVNEAPTFVPMATNAGLGQSKAMMIVGGAALVTGAIVGGQPGTIIMVGGAVIGLYGLYKYLQ